ncbi:hypothetical protein D3C86_1960380 [compost metagenome]
MGQWRPQIDHGRGEQTLQIDHDRAAATGNDVFVVKVDAVQGMDQRNLSTQSLKEKRQVPNAFARAVFEFFDPAVIVQRDHHRGINVKARITAAHAQLFKQCPVKQRFTVTAGFVHQ